MDETPSRTTPDAPQMTSSDLSDATRATSATSFTDDPLLPREHATRALDLGERPTSDESRDQDPLLSLSSLSLFEKEVLEAERRAIVLCDRDSLKVGQGLCLCWDMFLRSIGSMEELEVGTSSEATLSLASVFAEKILTQECLRALDEYLDSLEKSLAVWRKWRAQSTESTERLEILEDVLVTDSWFQSTLFEIFTSCESHHSHLGSYTTKITRLLKMMGEFRCCTEFMEYYQRDSLDDESAYDLIRSRDEKEHGFDELFFGGALDLREEVVNGLTLCLERIFDLPHSDVFFHPRLKVIVKSEMDALRKTKKVVEDEDEEEEEGELQFPRYEIRPKKVSDGLNLLGIRTYRISEAGGGGDESQPAYVLNIPIGPDVSAQKISDLVQMYADGCFCENSVESHDQLHRVWLCFFLNQGKRLQSNNELVLDEKLRDELCQLCEGYKMGLSIITGSWERAVSWVDPDSSSVDLEEVKRAFDNASPAEQARLLREEEKPREEAVPKTLIRHVLLKHPITREAIGHFKGREGPVYVVFGDDDAVSLRMRGGIGYLSGYDRILGETTLPTLMSTGYVFPRDEPNDVYYAFSLMDRKMRQLIHVKGGNAYFPEPNTALISDVAEKRYVGFNDVLKYRDSNREYYSLRDSLDKANCGTSHVFDASKNDAVVTALPQRCRTRRSTNTVTNVEMWNSLLQSSSQSHFCSQALLHCCRPFLDDDWKKQSDTLGKTPFVFLYRFYNPIYNAKDFGRELQTVCMGYDELLDEDFSFRLENLLVGLLPEDEVENAAELSLDAFEDDFEIARWLRRVGEMMSGILVRLFRDEL